MPSVDSVAPSDSGGPLWPTRTAYHAAQPEGSGDVMGFRLNAVFGSAVGWELKQAILAAALER